jgi:hypothetical protein
MILRRITSSLKDQHWATIVIELMIVIIGVFIGTQVSNWNEGRLEKQQTARMLGQLKPELDVQIDYFASVRKYYRTTQRYADVALAGWHGDASISDEQFVIAAYQASQIYGIGTNAQNWTLVFGGDQLRNIDNPILRRHLADVLTTDYSDVGLATMQTRYRTDVRLVIPNDIQVKIRAGCGDRLVRDTADQDINVLPEHCSLPLDKAEAAATASALRAHASLPHELALHLGSVDGYLQNVDFIEIPMRTLQGDLGQR